jgi:hypothetical protein
MTLARRVQELPPYVLDLEEDRAEARRASTSYRSASAIRTCQRGTSSTALIDAARPGTTATRPTACLSYQVDRGL